MAERWEQQKQSDLFADEDDPSPESVASGSDNHIPIHFKLKVAREEYNKLSSEEKKRVNDRRDEDRKKMYRSIPDIVDVEEREEKLSFHQQ